MKKEDHKQIAIELFNKTWSLIDLKSRTNEENLEMIHLAHSSRYHWGIAGTELQKGRGEWQISRVYSILEIGESALLHAEAYLDICLKNNIKDWDIAFAYEAIGYAYKVLGNNEQKEYYKQKGIDSLKNIKDKDDKEYAESELEKI